MLKFDLQTPPPEKEQIEAEQNQIKKAIATGQRKVFQNTTVFALITIACFICLNHFFPDEAGLAGFMAGIVGVTVGILASARARDMDNTEAAALAAVIVVGMAGAMAVANPLVVVGTAMGAVSVGVAWAGAGALAGIRAGTILGLVAGGVVAGALIGTLVVIYPGAIFGAIIGGGTVLGALAWILAMVGKRGDWDNKADEVIGAWADTLFFGVLVGGLGGVAGSVGALGGALAGALVGALGGIFTGPGGLNGALDGALAGGFIGALIGVLIGAVGAGWILIAEDLEGKTGQQEESNGGAGAGALIGAMVGAGVGALVGIVAGAMLDTGDLFGALIGTLMGALIGTGAGTVFDSRRTYLFKSLFSLTSLPDVAKDRCPEILSFCQQNKICESYRLAVVRLDRPLTVAEADKIQEWVEGAGLSQTDKAHQQEIACAMLRAREPITEDE